MQALLSLRYPRHEVVVVDDGSTDATFERLRAAFDLVPIPRELPAGRPDRAPRSSTSYVPRDGRTRLVVVRKENSGRSEAINVAINAATEPLVAMVDADSILDPDALLAGDPAVRRRPDPHGGHRRAPSAPVNGSRVVVGRIVQVQMPEPWLARIQVVEYLRAFLLGRTGWSRFGALILISGAFGMFRRDVVVEVGGLDADSIGEDFELVMRIHRQLHGRAARLPRRVRRRAGLVDRGARRPLGCCAASAGAGTAGSGRRCGSTAGCCGNPRYGRVGLVALPYYWVFELFAPLLELVGLVHRRRSACALGVVNVPYACVFLARRLRLRDPRDARGDGGRGVVLPQVRPVARPRARRSPRRSWRTSATASSPRGGGSRAGGPGSAAGSRSGAP